MDTENDLEAKVSEMKDLVNKASPLTILETFLNDEIGHKRKKEEGCKC